MNTSTPRMSYGCYGVLMKAHGMFRHVVTPASHRVVALREHLAYAIASASHMLVLMLGT